MTTRARVAWWRRLVGLWSRGPVPAGVYAIIAGFLWIVAISDPRWWRIVIAALWSALAIAPVIATTVDRRHSRIDQSLPVDPSDR